MKFGNWNIADTAIEWAGQGLHRFVIERQLLTETHLTEEPEKKLYKWIVLATQEDWLTNDDLYDLNFAFVFAAGAWQLNLNYELFDRTTEYQFELLDEEENEP